MDIILLLAAGVAAGVVNAIAGGGSLITFPSLIAVGLPTIDANVTNSVSVFPGYVASVVGSRADLAGQGRRLRAILPVSVAGTAGGCALLLLTPARVFEVIVPFLVLAAAATLAFQDRLRGLVGHPRALSPRRQQVTLQVVVFVGLALVLDEPLRRINALKNVLSTSVGLVTVVIFAIFAHIHWDAALTLAPATIIGGYVGAKVARRLPAAVLKITIVTFGTAIGLVLLYRV
jgi:uncharacterized membrane protein YfcA